MQIAIKDRSEAQAWQNTADALNARAQEAVKRAAQIVQEIKDMADGTLIDELFELGGALSNGAARLFEAMNAILDVVNNLLNAIENFKNEAIEFVKGAADYLIGN